MGNAVGNSAGKSCGKSCGKFLWEILEGKSGRTGRRGKTNLRKAVIGGNLAFGIR